MLFEPLPEVPAVDALPKGQGAKGPEGERGVDGNGTAGNEAIGALKEFGTDSNQTTAPAVAYEDVKDEVRKRILEGDKLDADREATELAQESALKFLETINSSSDRLLSVHGSYEEIRRSKELKDILKESGGQLKRIAFSSQDMPVQARVLGLQTRESERKANRNPLEEVEALTEKRFFTRSIRKTQKGYAVFILDRKTTEKPGAFEKANFGLLYREYVKKVKVSAFSNWVDKQYKKLEKSEAAFSTGEKVSIEAKSAQAVRASFDAKGSKIRNQLRKLQDEKNEITSAEGDKNATKSQIARKPVLDKEIEALRDSQSEVSKQRLLTNQLLEVVDSLEPDGQWVEQERTEDSALFVRLTGVYTLRNQTPDQEQLQNRVRDLEYSRAEMTRSLLLDNLIASGLGK
jgi:hypothetical protein